MSKRLTGFSTPFGGLSWESAVSPKKRIEELFFFLESRRLLTSPIFMEVISQCVESAIEIREALVSSIKDVNFSKEDIRTIQAMIDGSNTFPQSSVVKSPF